jgi:cell shape-determining protein MreD
MIKRIVLILILFTLMLIESSLWSFPLSLLLVLNLGLLMGDESYIWAFIAGFVLDIFTLRQLGVDSLYFLIVCFIIVKYQKKVNVVNYLYMSIFTGVVLCLYGYYYYKNINISYIIMSIAGSLIALRLISWYFPELILRRNKISLNG